MTRMTIAPRAAAVGVAVAMLALAGCGSGSTTPPASSSSPSESSTAGGGGAGVELNWYAFNLNTSTAMADIVTAFEEANPGVTVTLETAPPNVDTVRGTLTTKITGGSPTPDVYTADIVWTNQFAKANLVSDLTDLITPEARAQTRPELLEGGMSGGRLYCVPFVADVGIMYYRTDLLDAAGLPYPTTWEELAQTAAKLQKEGAVKHGLVWRGAPYEGLSMFWTELIATAGGSSVNADYTEATIDSEAGRKALNFLVGTIKSGVSPQAVSTFQETEAMNVFNEGDAVFMASNAYVWGTTQDPAVSKVVGKVAMAPMPTFEGQPSPGYSATGGSTLCLNPNTEHQAEAVKLIEFMAGPVAQRILATTGQVIPTATEVQSDPEVAKANPPVAVLPELNIVNRPAGTSDYASLSQAIYQNINAAASGTKSPEDALKSAQEEINSVLKGGGI